MGGRIVLSCVIAHGSGKPFGSCCGQVCQGRRAAGVLGGEPDGVLWRGEHCGGDSECGERSGVEVAAASGAAQVHGGPDGAHEVSEPFGAAGGQLECRCCGR